ncbi:MAG: glycosyltransferase family 39 protein, partial [Patescibacteria group bacterium]
SYALRSRRAGIYAATLLAVSPWVISYGWEARMYPLGMVFALLSSYALLHAIRDKSFTWFSLYGLLAVALAYTHYYWFFTIAGQILFTVGVLVRSTKWRIGEMVQSRIFWGGVLSASIAIVLFSPWLPVFLQQLSQVQNNYWVPPIASTSIPDTFYHFFVPTVDIVPHHGLILLVSLLPIVGTIILWLYCSILFRKNDGVRFIVLLGVVPMLMSIFISFTGRSLYNDRFFAFSGIFIFVLIAYVLSVIKKPILRRILFLLFVLGLLLALMQYRNELDIEHKIGSHAATKYIYTERKNTEQVLVSSPFVYFAVLHYATEEFLTKDDVHLYSKTGELSHFSGGPILTQADIVGAQDIAKFKGVVWVVDTTGFGEGAFEQPKNWQEIYKQPFPEVFGYQGDVIVRKFLVHL